MFAALSQHERGLTRAALGLLLLCVGLFAFFGNLLFLGIPFAALVLAVMFVQWKTAFWFMLFSVAPSIQIWFLGESLSTSVPDEPMMWAFLLISAALLVSKPKIFPTFLWRNSLSLIIALQYLWLIVAVVYSHVPLLSVKFLLAKTWFLAAFLVIPTIVFREKKDWVKGFWLVLIPTTLLTMVVFYKHWRLGFSFELIQVAVRYLFYNHVDYSTFLSMVFPVLCVAWALCKGKGVFVRAALLLLIVFYGAAIHFAYARAAVLAVVFAFTVMAAIRLRLVNLILPIFYGFIMLIVVYAAKDNRYIDYRPDYSTTYMHKSFKEHLIATFKGKDMSSMERVYRWIGAARMSTDEPLKGWGPNSFYFYYKPYTNTSFVTYVSRNPERSTTHNYFLLMLVEQGWPAMLLYALLILCFFAKAQRVYHRHKDRFYKGCTLAIAGMFAACFVNNFFSELIETHKVGSLFYLCIALLIVLDHKSRQAQKTAENADTLPAAL